MSRGEVKEIAESFVRVWSAGNLEFPDELADPEIRVSYPHFDEPVRGRDAFRELLERTFRHFPDLQTTPATVIAEGDGAAVEWAYVGTHRHGELFGVRPAGTRIRVQGAPGE